VKRFVVVPSSMVIDGNIPQQAIDLCNKSGLSARIEDDCEIVKIASFPEVNIIDCDPIAKTGFIHSIDFTNDFVTFNDSASLEIIETNANTYYEKPSLREEHVIKFRVRFSSPGIKMYSVMNDSKAVISGQIEVI